MHARLAVSNCFARSASLTYCRRRGNHDSPQDAVFEGRGSNKRGRDRDDAAPFKRAKVDFAPNIVAVIDGLGEGADFRSVKDCFSACGDVKYVELQDGKAFVRFADAEAAAMASQVDEVDGTKVTVGLLGGDEEKQYWERLWSRQDAAHERDGGRGGRGRGGRRGRGRGRGRDRRNSGW